MNSLNEEWRPVLGYEGIYEVSSLGCVRSVGRLVPHSRFGEMSVKGRVLKLFTSADGYKQAAVCTGGMQRTRLVHSLVAEAFIGPRPSGCEVCHNDGNRSNNAASNLRYGTRRENQSDRVLHGTTCRGERCVTSKLTESDVLEIRSSSLPQRKVAAIFGVSQRTISQVRRGVTWAHIACSGNLREAA